MSVAFFDAHPCGASPGGAGSPVGSLDWFRYVRALRYAGQPHIRPFMEPERWRARRVLEIGCGIGTDAAEFAWAGAAVTAVEPSAVSLSIAKRRPEQVRWLMRLADVPWQVDLIYSFGVLHHVGRPDVLLAEARGRLRPGGTLKLMVYHRRSLRALQLRLRHGRQWWRYTERYPGVPISRAYTRKEIRRLVESAGFTVAYVEVAHASVDWPGADRLAGRFGWHLLVEAVRP